MKRKLVTIQKIYDIQDIPGRQKVQRGKVLGWDVIVRKGLFKNSELVCFAEIDSLFPNDGNWDELEKSKYRIKTFKVNTSNGPIYGQGYCFPLTVLEKYDNNYPRHYEENEEITNLIGVTKYEPPCNFSTGDTLGTFPTKYISQTDEMRLQSALEVLNEIKGKPYIIRQKVDGTSGTSFLEPNTVDNFIVCSRSFIKKNPLISGKKCNYWTVFNKYNLDKVYTKYPDYAMQYEIIGEGIQKNRLQIKGFEIRVFNILKLSERRYLDDIEFEEMLIKFKEISPKLEACKVIERGESFNYTLEDLIKISMHVYDSGAQAEGIVIRPQVEQHSNVLGGRLSFKVINPEFLSRGGN